MAEVKTGKFNFDGEEWTHVSESAKSLIRKILIKDPKKRPSA